MGTMKTTKLSKVFITGCDVNTQWQLPWFVHNFEKHVKNTALRIMDFGMEGDNPFEDITIKHMGSDHGWFKKPGAMLAASKLADKVCWLDTDCEVLDNIEDIFDHTNPNKLSMAKDNPWSTRSNQTWHNSGVVVFEGCPPILNQWATAIVSSSARGDQEELHMLVGQNLERMPHIHDLDRSYNTLRLDLIDKSAPKKIKVMHWTGALGNKHIREEMNI